ncbi:hypothetical protein Tco_0809246 [Tanacetum coccineum]
MESLNSKEREMHQLQQMQDNAKESLIIRKFFLAYTQIEVRQFRDILIQHIESVKKSIDERAMHTREYDNRVNERQMRSKEGNADSSKTLDANLVVTKSNETESERHVSSSRSGNDTHDEDEIINSVNGKQPMAEVQLSAEHNILANEQQHFEQSESIYDTYLLEKVDRNATPDSTDMSHRGGEIDQNAKKCQVSCPLLDPSFDNMTIKFSNQFLEFENISLKKTVAQLQRDFSRMETHCVNMELKYQNQVLKNGQHDQILNETSNDANIKREINVLETRNIDLEICGARLLAENKKLNMENKHLKQTYKDLSDSIKKTSVQTKDHADSLIVQLNCIIFNTGGLRWVPIGKKFTSSTTKVDCEPLNGSNEDITNPYECNQTLNVSACTLNLSAGPALHEMTPAIISSGLVPNPPFSTLFVPPSRSDWDLLFQPLFDELHTPPPSVDHLALEVIALIAEVVAPEPAASTGSPSSTTVDQDSPSPSNSQTTPETQSPVIPNDVEEDNHALDVAHMNNDPFFGIPIPKNDYEASSSSDIIPTVVHTATPNSEHVTK